MTWRDWSYDDWNEQLLDHCLRATGSTVFDVVERIAATPEELKLLSRDSAADSGQVVDAFVTAVRRQLPFHQRTLCGFAFEYKGWQPTSERPPHFFGMLWFTCLVAWGYPDHTLDFYRRIREALGKADNLRAPDDGSRPGLPMLWADLSAWTVHQRAIGGPIRELRVPEDLGHRTAIGYSWFLAFPHKADRNTLAESLAQAGLVGFEPPIQPVIQTLHLNLRRFSSEFQADFASFSRALDGGADPKNSAFWRAVRQEALEPSLHDGATGGRAEERRRCGLLVWDTEEGLRPVVCGPEDVGLPVEYARLQLDDPIGRYTWYAAGRDGDLDGPAENALNRGGLVSLGHRRLSEQGLLLLCEESTGVFSVVSGSEAHGVSRALVRMHLLEAFRNAFGGTTYPSLVDGWAEVSGCRVVIGPSLPKGLEAVLQLLPTMQPRGVLLVGGIRLPGAFLWFPSYLPRVRAPGAESVVVTRGAAPSEDCSRADDGQDDWKLPAWQDSRPGRVEIEARWAAESELGQACATTGLTFVDRSSSDDFRTLPAGAYRMESGSQPETEIYGPGEVRLEFLSEDPSASADLLLIDGTLRYLGPGVGQMSRQPRPGFDWLVAGHASRPDLLLFVGDPSSPTPPAQLRSPDKGDRRHWRHAVSHARMKAVRRPDGTCVPLQDHPLVEQALRAYSSNSPPTGAAPCEATELDVAATKHGSNATMVPIAREALEALAGLSVRRSGLHYSDLRSLLTPLVGSQPLAIQQLLRAWTESGLIDMVRDARRGAWTICARRPSLVLTRRGPVVEGTVWGLLSQNREDRLRDVLGRHASVAHELVMPPNEFQPSLHRIRGSESDLGAVAADSGIDRVAWLSWPDAGEVPGWMDVNQAYRLLREDQPPPQYKLNATWDWGERLFRRDRGAPALNGVAIQRRVHPTGSSIYVVLNDDCPACWTGSRNWAVLFGYELAGTPAFRREADGTLLCEGLSPVQLPLPMARLCGIIGAGLPGPVLAAGRVSSYRYPFGNRLYSLVAAVIPPSWLRQK